ncbi:MAG: peptidoglycan DD-metalloendopeptidase family protein [Anaerolineae bacterium]|nr:peptidoglycan DD-metalloendopeptidase family protein [Anaerolineae bacterium]
MRRYLLGLLSAFLMFGTSQAVTAQQSPIKPFGLPFSDPPGPITWLLDQQFGNTVGALNYGRYWYAAGQNLHFGVDFAAPCNTPVVAIGDGEIDQVDNMSFGLEPHNLTIFHRDLRLTSLYGHLNVKSTLLKGQPIRRGEIIGYSGDPDLTCESRPHLHLEIRSSDYSLAYNPINYINADWDGLATIGYHLFGGFIKDLNHPNRWQTATDQPDIDFNEAPLNEYAQAWPPPVRSAPPPYTRPTFSAAPITGEPTMHTLSRPGCCSWAWWAPDSQSIRYWDGPDGQPAQIFAQSINGGDPQVFDTSYQIRSADDRYKLVMTSGRVSIFMPDGAEVPLSTGGAFPQFSPSIQRLLWHRYPADDIPGSTPPATEVWISGLDGSNRQLLKVQQGGSVYWLDEDRVLLSEPIGRANKFRLSLFTISTQTLETMLPEAGYMRALAVAPGGKYVLIYAPFQQDPTNSGMYLLQTVANTAAVRLPLFGSYRWRDSNSFFYLPYLPDQRTYVMLYDITTGQSTAVTDANKQPIRVTNDDWSVSPDGMSILYWDGSDYTLRTLTWK